LNAPSESLAGASDQSYPAKIRGANSVPKRKIYLRLAFQGPTGSSECTKRRTSQPFRKDQVVLHIIFPDSLGQRNALNNLMVTIIGVFQRPRRAPPSQGNGQVYLLLRPPAPPSRRIALLPRDTLAGCYRAAQGGQIAPGTGGRARMAGRRASAPGGSVKMASQGGLVYFARFKLRMISVQLGTRLRQ
jgi:hypothetical protein